MATTLPEPQRGLTIEDVWAALMEDRKQIEIIREENRKEAERREKEVEQQRKEAEQQRKEHVKWKKEREKYFKKSDEDYDRIRRLVEENGRQIGGLHRSFGELAEHLVAPNIAERFNELGFKFERFASGGEKFYGEDGKVKTEVDILLENRKYIIAVEVKTRPAEKDIGHHIKRLEILREHWDKHNDSRKILGAIAGAIFPKDIKKAVLEAGLYVLEQSGDTMKIEVPKDSAVREW